AGVLDRSNAVKRTPSKRASPSEVPTQRYPSSVCATARIRFCGRPSSIRQIRWLYRLAALSCNVDTHQAGIMQAWQKQEPQKKEQTVVLHLGGAWPHLIRSNEPRATPQVPAIWTFTHRSDLCTLRRAMLRDTRIRRSVLGALRKQQGAEAGRTRAT